MTVLVIGAAGDLGGRVVRELRALSTPVRAFVRRPEAVAEIDAAEVVLGDLGDMSSVMAASEGVRAVFLVSSPSRAQVELETNVIEAAERTGIERIVKVSNIPVPGLESGLHGNHRTIERRLDRSPVASTVLQPTFFTTVMDRQRDLIARGTVVLPFGTGRVAWIDPDDIAAVAAVALTRDIESPLRLTGPESLDGDEVAARLGVRRLDPPLADWHERVVASGLDPWLAASTVELYAAVARGALDHVSPDVERALGRPPTSRLRHSGRAPVILLPSEQRVGGRIRWTRDRRCGSSDMHPSPAGPPARMLPTRRGARGRGGRRRRRTRRSRPNRPGRRCRT